MQSTSDEHPAMIAARRLVALRRRREAMRGAGSRCWPPASASRTRSACRPHRSRTGKGIRGLEEAKAFWERNIATTSIQIQAHESFAADSESAHVLTLTTSFPNGVKIVVHGIFTYRVNDAGKLTNLRGYWTMADAKIEKPA